MAATLSTNSWEYPYDPSRNPKQVAAHEAHVDELLYGGAAGGGKTDYLLAEVLGLLLRWPDTAGVVFRRTFEDLRRPGGIIPRLLDRIPQPDIGRYNAGDHTWRFTNGSVLELAHLQRDADVAKYQGAEYAIAAWDQLEQFTEYQYRYIIDSRLRIDPELAAAGLRPRSVATANPGGVGHTWVKARWIDPAAPMVPWLPEPTDDEPNPGWRIFIPADVADNPHVDAGYRRRLERLPSDQRRALRWGDWDVYVGQRFKDFRRDAHVIEPEDLPLAPREGVRALGVDYGMDAPFACLWGVRLGDDLTVITRELYKAGLTPEEQARLVLASEADGERTPAFQPPAYLDPSTWARDASDPDDRGDVEAGIPPRRSIAGRYRQQGLPIRRGNNDRRAGVARIAELMRVRDDGRPRLLIMSNCRHLIRTLPALPRSSKYPEDVDTKAEDHLYDALRYLVFGLDGRPKGQRYDEDPRGQPPMPAETANIEHAGF